LKLRSVGSVFIAALLSVITLTGLAQQAPSSAATLAMAAPSPLPYRPFHAPGIVMTPHSG